MTAIVWITSLVASSLCLAVGYALVNHLAGMGALLGFILLWPLARWRRWHWFPSLHLGMAVFAAMSGVLFYEVSLAWMFAGLLWALLAWDLEAFARRLNLAAEQDDRPRLERTHLLKLVNWVTLAVLLALGAYWVPLQVSFGWSFWLVILLAVGLTRTVVWLRQRGRTG